MIFYKNISIVLESENANIVHYFREAILKYSTIRKAIGGLLDAKLPNKKVTSLPTM